MTKPRGLTKEQISTMSGREILQAAIDGKLPQATMADTLNAWLVEVGDGFAAFEGEPTEHVLNPMGTVHAGFAMTLIDSATGCACHSTLPPGMIYTTIETKVNFVRAILPETGRVRAEGRVVSRGKQIITAEAKLLSADGRVLAHGTSTMMVLVPR
jgi:uncharacterized protein (TIGR00369 family)